MTSIKSVLSHVSSYAYSHNMVFLNHYSGVMLPSGFCPRNGIGRASEHHRTDRQGRTTHRLHANKTLISSSPLFRHLHNLLPSCHSDRGPHFVPKYGRTTRSPCLDRDLAHTDSVHRSLPVDRQG